MSQLIMAEGANPPTPSTGKAVIHIDASGNLCKTDDAGNTMVLVCAGDFSLTIPATGVAALLGVAQTFTTPQTIAPAAVGDHAVVVNMPASTTGSAHRTSYNGTLASTLVVSATLAQLTLSLRDLGNDVAGPAFIVGRNTSAGAVGPAAGTLRMVPASASTRHLWVDDAGLLRIHTASPTGNTGAPTVSDTAGTIVGTQSSMAEAKLISDDLSVLDEVMARVRAGAEAVRRFKYRSGSFNDQVFEGIVTDYAPAYGMDRDADHPQGKSLNTVQIIGDLLRTVDWLAQKVAQLEARL